MFVTPITISQLVVREVRSSEIKSVAEVHAAALPNDIFPSLGARFLLDYYSHSLEPHSKDKAKLLGAFDGDHLVGFCQIVLIPTSFLKTIKLRAFPRILILLLIRPWVFLNAIIQLFFAVKLENGIAELAFIAVDPAYQRCGVGRSLISAAMSQASKNKISWIITKTANKQLSSFYQNKLKAQVVKCFSTLWRDYEILRLPINS